MATIGFDNKENIKSQNGVNNTQQVHHQQIIIENPRDMDLSYCEIHQKNKPQSNSVTGGIMLLIASGLHIGWGIWRTVFFEPWSLYISLGMGQFVLMSWYVFAVVGSVVGAILVTKMRKKMIYYIGGALLVASNIMFIAVYEQYEAIIVGRCLAGLAHGIVYNAAITHASENVVKEIRGTLMSSINCVMFSGVFVSTVLIASFTYIYNDDSLTSDVVIGIFGLVFSLFGIICTAFLTYESIPYLLRRDNEAEAIVNLLKLRNESVMTPKLTNEFDEMKQMVDRDRQDNENILSDGNGSATGKMIALRTLSTMTNNFFINGILISMTTFLFNPFSYYLAPVVLAGCRLAASIIPIFSTDCINRKIHLTVSGATSGVVMLILAILIATTTFYAPSTSWVLGTLCIIFQIFVALGIDPMQHLLLSEAFSTSKKAWSIAMATSVEYMLQILFIGLYFIGSTDRLRLNVILFVTAGVMLVLTLFLEFAVPETRKKSLKETRDLYRK